MMRKLKLWILGLCSICMFVCVQPVKVEAYTYAEKQMAKDWLSAHGYPPTWAGAEAAYQDYLNGKWQDEARKYLGDEGDVLDDEEEEEESAS